MYMNRLRHDDFVKMFELEEHKILLNQPDTDEEALELLHSGTLEIDEKLAATSAWIVSEKIN
jgi:hypothetical protein